MTDPRALLDREDCAPRAFAALRAVLDLHPRIPGLPGTMWCLTCWKPGREAMEPVPWPCATVQAITTALEGRT